MVKKDLATGEKRVDKLTEEVANLKVQIEGVNAKMNEVHSGKGEVNAEAGGAGDPWGDYLRRQRAGGDITGTSKSAAPNTSGQGGLGGELASSDQLSEEDRRTLIVGGWLQDTRRVTIEEEVAPLLSHPDIKPLLDAERLAIYGPRRSVGMLKFQVRSDEGRPEDLRARMWKVVRKISELKMPVESARAMGEDRTMWASFVKTKAARTRSSHISMVRRIVMGLASDAKNESGGVLNYEHTQLGRTIWIGMQGRSGVVSTNSPLRLIAVPGTRRLSR